MTFVPRSLKVLAVAVHASGLLLLCLFGGWMLVALHPAVEDLEVVPIYRSEGGQVAYLAFHGNGMNAVWGRRWKPVSQAGDAVDTRDMVFEPYFFYIYDIEQRTRAGVLIWEHRAIRFDGERMVFLGLLLAGLPLAAPASVRAPLTALYGKILALPLRLLRGRRRPQGFEVLPPNATGERQ